MEVFHDLHPNNLRYLFYMVTPNETTFSSVDLVPDYTKLASPWMFVLMLIEFCFLRPDGFALNDTITSMTSGMLYMLVKIGGRYFSAAMYIRAYPHLHLVSLDPSAPFSWLICFLTMDLCFYLAHRAMHECSIFWAFHQMHHSSEYYNLSTAMRKGVFLEVGNVFFDLLQAFFIPPEIFLPHKYLNLLYQYWLHTELVPPLGPLEYIINTPSSHRVHHGRNPYCIDKNYAGTLIIWDRLFGTYTPERRGEQISYGLVTNPRSFNPTWLQWFEFLVYGWQKGQMRDEEGKEYFPGTWSKLKVPFQPPGYYPGVPVKRFFWWWHLQDSTFGIPEVDTTEAKYNPPLSTPTKMYLAAQFVFLAGFALRFDEVRLMLGWFEFVSQLVIILATIQMFGYYFDRDPMAPFHDKVRCFGLLAYTAQARHALLAMVAIFSLPCIAFFEYEEKKRREADGAAVATAQLNGEPSHATKKKKSSKEKKRN